MLPVKLALEAYPADRATESCPLGALHFGFSWRATSPKTDELRARYRALHAAECDLNAMQLVQV